MNDETHQGGDQAHEGADGAQYRLAIPLWPVMGEQKQLVISYSTAMVRCTLEADGEAEVCVQIDQNYRTDLSFCLRQFERVRSDISRNRETNALNIVYAVWHALLNMHCKLRDAVNAAGTNDRECNSETLRSVLRMKVDVEKARFCKKPSLLRPQFDATHGHLQGEPLVPLELPLRYACEPIMEIKEGSMCYSDQWDGQGEPLVALEDDTADETYVMMEFENVGLY